VTATPGTTPPATSGSSQDTPTGSSNKTVVIARRVGGFTCVDDVFNGMVRNRIRLTEEQAASLREQLAAIESGLNDFR
jgi:hypothetical protein